MVTPPEPQDRGAEPVPDAARAVMSRVRSAARAAAPALDRRSGPAPRPKGRRRRSPGFSGPGADDRDPMPVGGAWRRLVAEQGWRESLDVAGLEAMWPQIVGPANAEHAVPESFDPSSRHLVVRTSSTAWAEQLRLMLPALRASIDARLGAGVVADIRVVGPTPPRTRGRLRVRGRGPRDTYG